MNRRVASSLSIVAVSLAAVLLGSCTRREGAASVPKPADPSSEEVLGYLAIPSLEKALRDVSAVAERFAPGQTTPETLKAQIGGMLNDPQLSGLETEKPILVCALRAKEAGQPPSIAAMLPVKQGAPYAQTLAGLGMMTQASGGLLLVSQNQEGLETAAKAKGMYEQIAGAGPKKSARLYLHLARLMDAYGPLLESQLDGLFGSFAAAAAVGAGGAGMDPESLVKVLKMEVQGLLALLRQCEAAQVDLDLGSQRIGFDQVVTARPGSALAEGFSSSSRRPSPSATLMEGGGFLAGAFRCDAGGFSPLFRRLLEAANRGSEGFLPEGAIKAWADMGEWWGGTTAFTMRPGKEGAFVIEYVVDVLDEAKALGMIEKASELIAPGTGLGDMYRGMGIEMKLEKDARQHKGVSIYRLKMSIAARQKDAEKDAAKAAGAVLTPGMEFMKAWVKDMEGAFVKGTGLWSNDPTNIDRMIDEALSSTARRVTLEAQKVYGAGCHGYLDYDLVGLLKSVMSALPEGQGQALAMFGKVTSKAPMVFAVTFSDARARLQGQVPVEPFAQIAEAAKPGK